MDTHISKKTCTPCQRPINEHQQETQTTTALSYHLTPAITWKTQVTSASMMCKGILTCYQWEHEVQYEGSVQNQKQNSHATQQSYCWVYIQEKWHQYIGETSEFPGTSQELTWHQLKCPRMGARHK